MQNVLLTIHLIACIALVIAVMLQRSEGGALGMGGGGTGGLISGRGAANVLVRTTMALAGVFFVTSIVMTRLNNDTNSQPSLLEREASQTTDPFDTLNQQPTTPATVTTAPSPTAPADATVTPPSNAAPAPATTAPATATPDPLAPKAPAPKPATPATTPATTAPTTPATTPENGGSPTP